MSSHLIKDLKCLWVKNSLPIASDKKIIHKVRKYLKKFCNIKKSLKSGGRINSSKSVVSCGKTAEEKLFDISLCKCKNFPIYKFKVKVPIAERAFLINQRTSHRM